MYTKHYYNGSSRITSRIGGGFNQHNDLNNYSPLTDHVQLQNSNDYTNKAQQLRNVWSRNASCAGLDQNLEYAYSLELNPLFANPQPDGERYFYHSDHLGSSAYITTENGYATQFLAYMPFGETLSEQQNSTSYYSPFKFSAKEKDLETGYSYFGARYYSPELSVWLGVDPLSDEFPSWTPYHYVHNNPVNMIDPDGRKADWFENEVTGEIYYNSSLSKGDEKNLGEGWKWMGENGMFGESDATLLFSNENLTSSGVHFDKNSDGSGNTSYNLSASFSGTNARGFMNKLGYEFMPKTSYEAIRHDFPESNLQGRSIENQSGLRVISASSYVKKGLYQNAKIHKFYEVQNLGNSYTRYSRTDYTYTNNVSRNNIINLIGVALSIYSHSYKTTNSEYITEIQGWNNVTDKRLLNLRGR